MAETIDRLPISRLSLQSGMMVVGGLLVALIGVLLLRDGQNGWWALLAVGAINVFSGAVTFYQHDPAEYSVGNGWLALGFVALVFELALLVFVALQ
ncbi:hypothetical protein [Halococcus hamelinensis]|uniref:Uncharacterized protein n=1 Tax=Halococcus hamelinensis 100A6 TaxID=1132509 RepID=M0LYX7_9EURY|nr:hypothetical protein [Halococcus hamelinensis]EMA38373.1 hypothetical protein C447_09462 [Halococcus hamelinensis 100A6]